MTRSTAAADTVITDLRSIVMTTVAVCICDFHLSHTVIDLGLISIAPLGPKALTKVESHVNFTESQKVSRPIFFAIVNTEKLAKTIN